MGNYYVGSVGYGRAKNPTTGEFYFNTTTLTDSGFTTSLSNQEIRGGDKNSLQGILYHTGMFNVTMTDCLADMVYISMQTGGDVVAGANIYKTETITTTVLNQITVTGTPQAYLGLGTIGWYTVAGEEGLPTKITFSGSVASTTIAIGTKVCVTYLVESDTARIVEVLSAFAPKIVDMEFVLPLYPAGTNASTVNTAGQVGEYIVHVPKLQLDGALSLSTTSSTNAPMAINGMALAYTTNAGCANKSVYATITENIFDAGVFDNVSAIAIDGEITELTVSATGTLTVYAKYNNGTAISALANSNFTFTSATPAVCTVGGSTGVLTAVSAGTALITATAVGATNLTDNITITVTA